MATIIKGTGCVGHPDNWCEEEYVSCPDCGTPLEESPYGGYERCECKSEVARLDAIAAQLLDLLPHFKRDGMLHTPPSSIDAREDVIRQAITSLDEVIADLREYNR